MHCRSSAPPPPRTRLRVLWPWSVLLIAPTSTRSVCWCVVETRPGSVPGRAGGGHDGVPLRAC